MAFKNQNYKTFLSKEIVAPSCKFLSVAVGCPMVVLLVIGAVVTDVETELG